MSLVWRLFDPLWKLIADNTWVSVTVMTVATVAAFLEGQHFAAMLPGGALGTVLMRRAEAIRTVAPGAEDLVVHLPKA